MNPTLVVLLVFLAAVAVAAAVGLVLRDLRRPTSVDEAPKPMRLQRLRPLDDQVEGQGAVASFDRWFLHLLQEAGLDWNPTITAVLLAAWGTLCGFAMFFWDERLAPAVAAGVVGMALPLGFLIIRRSRRLAKIEEQLPPALETLARSIRAGRTLDQAIAMVGEHTPEPLAKELRWCARQLEMGLAIGPVMRSLMQRVRLYDVRIFGTTLIVHRQTGGNVVSVLERLAQVVRERLNYRRQLRATTAAGRMSAGLIAILAPGVFVYFFFFQPEYLRSALQSSLGQTTLLIAAVLEVIGVVWTLRLVRPNY